MNKLLLFLGFLFIGIGLNAEKLYWVGGSGNFTDASHWSIRSGGKGGIKSPDSNDDVVFDKKSFNSAKTLKINFTSNQICKNFEVLVGDAPIEFEAINGLILKVGGNFVLSKNTKWNFSGTLELLGEGNLNVAFGHNKCQGDILFNSASGYFQLINGLKLNGSLILENGHLIANEKLISAKKLVKKSKSNFDLNLESCNLIVDDLIDVTKGLKVNGSYTELKCLSSVAFDSAVFSNLRVYNPNETFAATINSVVIVDSVSCNGLNDGSFLVTFTVNGAQAVPPYHLTFQPGGITFSNVTSPFLATGLSGTNYTVRLFNTATAFPPGTQIALSAGNIMYEPSLFGVNYDALISPLCNGDCNGEIQFDVDGGNPTYNVVINPGNHIINGLDRLVIDSIENLCASTYTVDITDRKGCSYSETITLSEPTAIVPNENGNDQVCFGVCTSVALVNPSGGTPFSSAQPSGLLYAVEWNGNPVLNNDSLSNLCPGTYNYIVTDANNCPMPGSVTINPVNQITFTPSVPAPISCSDVSDGTANVSAVAGGTTPYSFSWSGPCVPTVVNTLTSSTASNMCAGSYTVTITDANGCDTTQTFTIVAPALLVGSVAPVDVSCAGGIDGSATASQVGGTGPVFTHAWYSSTNPVGGPPMVANAVSVSNLLAGTYTMIVVDAAGCNDTVIFNINEPLPLVISLTPTNPSCFNGTDGQVCASSAGGTGAVSYTWSPAGFTVAANCYTNLPAGTYTADATDDNGCPATASITLTSPAQINISVVTTDPNCDNSCDGTAIATPSGGNGAPYTYSWSCAADIDSTVTGLCDVACTVTVNDALGCNATANFSLTDPVPLTVTLTNTPINCNGAATAQIASLVGGGTPPYTYSWNTGPVTPGLSNVGAGTYTLTVTDANSCVQTATITITQPLPISIAATVVNPTCNGDCDGTITTVLGGGTPAYSVLWVPGNSTNLNQSNLCSGSYTITVTDSRSCVMTDTIDLVDIVAITVDVDSTDASCLGTCDGTATANPSGGNGGYTYQWDDSANQTGNPATALCAGSYNVIVTDVGGCTGAGTITINEPTLLTVSVGNVTPSCSNICTGTADITASGGTAAYTFSLDGGPGFGSTNLSGLCAGTHTIDVTDANGCTATTTFTVDPKVLVVITSTTTSLTCFGDCNGSATANVAGGTAPIVYQWDLDPPTIPTPQATSSVSNLCAGTHTITVSDGVGCVVTSTITFTEPPMLTGSVVETPVNCSGDCSGVATVTPAGGTSPYTVTWSEGSIGITASNLCLGTYTATVTDANGCTISPTANITQPFALTVANVSTNPTTCSGSDGSIVVTPSGGSGNYTYSWTPVIDADSTLSGVPSGIYTVTITDAAGCDTTLNYALSDPGGPTTTQNSTNETCPNACNGTGTVDVTASTGAATVTWPFGGPSGPAPQSNFNLCPGVNYNVLVTDATGCQTFETVSITGPADFIENPVLTNLNCNGDGTGSIVLNMSGGTPFYSYTIDGNSDDNIMSGLSAGPHTIIITDSQFCTDTVTYILTQPTVLDLTETHTATNCTTGFGSATATASGGTLPYSYSWSNGANTATIVNLSAGTYTCTVSDGNGCTDTVSVNIQPNPVLVSGFTFTDNQCAVGCSGTAAFNASGGSGTYTYSWNYTASTASSQTGICIGSYTAIVSDNNGCSITETFTISATPAMSVSLAGTNPICNGSSTGSIITTVTGGTAAYTYSWSPIVSSLQNPTSLPAGIYIVDVTDANGCTATANVTLTDNPILLSSATPTQPNCFGDCNGFIVSSPVGGTSPYTFAWGPNPISVNDTLANLCIGTYSVVVTDFNGCTDTTTVNLTQPQQVGLIASVSPATCGLIPCDGSIVINNIIGNNVVWLNSVPPGFTGLSQTNLCAGIYNIEVSDINSCKDTVSFGVGNNSGPVVNVDSTDVTCIGNCDGTATVVSVVGNSPYSYSWGAPIPDLDSIATGLCVGSYLSQVTDAINCVTITSVTINEPLPLDDHEVITDATCLGLSDGCITLAPTGGTAPYNYVWSNGAPNLPTNCNLAPGVYTVDITDANGCTSSFSYNVGSNTQLGYLLSVTNNTCFGQCNGTATLNNITGGTAPFTYIWSDGQSGLFANGLCAGTYSVTITDNIGCLRIIDTAITEPVQLIANPTVTNTACGLCAGSITLAPSGGSGTYTYNWSNGQTTATSTNLCAGIYMVDVSDAVGCVTQFSVAVNNTSGPTVNTAITDVSCAGQCTGSAIVTAAGGTAPYQYNWISGGQTTAAVTNMCAGTYFVQVKDAANCVTNDTVVIAETTNLLANASITPTNCGVCTGAVTLTPSGGTAPYTYLWLGVVLPPDSAQSNLCAGSYTVEITDNLGCKDTNFISINSTNAPIVSVATDSVICNGSNNGQATVSIAGGTSPYTVLWSTGSNADPTEINLAAGNYNVTVTDASGCASVKNFSIEEPNPISMSLNNTQLPSCSAVCNGALAAIPNGGTLPYVYTWNPGGASTDTLSNLCAGVYNVIVTDANGCSATQTSTLNDNANPFAITPTNVDATCGSCDGSSSLVVSGGFTPYVYNWSNGSSASSSSNLCAGVYMVDITDSVGCAVQYSVAISNTNAPTLTITTTDINCAGSCTGAASVVASGGVTPYQYNWISGAQTSASVNGLCAGTYFVQVKDANNCTATQQVDILELTTITANASSTPATCGVSDGTAGVSPTGGSGNYSYQWPVPLPPTSTQTGLSAGTYSVIITDNTLGCSDTVFVSVSSTNAPTVSLDADSVSCNGLSDGQAVLTINGGSSPYTVLWSTGAPGMTLTGLPAGTYAVSVTDAVNCVSALNFVIDEPSAISLSLNNTQLPNCNAVCNGALTAIPNGGILPYSYSWSPGGAITDTLTNLCPGSYTVDVTDANGCAVNQTTLLNPNPTPFTVASAVTEPGCNQCNGLIDLTVSGGFSPYDYAWSSGDTIEDISNVCAGIYDINIVDSMGCDQTVSLTISNVNGITGDSANVTNETCFGTCDGTVAVFPIGGTPGYTYLWLHDNSTTSSLTGLCAGTYFVEITDTNGCIRATQVDIQTPTQMIATPSVVSPTCGANDGSITLNISGGTGALTYTWLPGVAGNTNIANNLAAGSYTITVQDAATTPCLQTFTVNLSNANGPMVSTTYTDISCFGLCDGSININITSPNPTTVIWNTGSASNPFTSLCEGNYSALITDNVTGCVSSANATIAEPDTLMFSIANVVEPICFGDCTGIINAVPSGGTLPYVFSWSPIAGSVPNQDSLCANTYSLTVTDNNGCVATQTTTINAPSAITATGIITDASCSGAANGAIDVTVSGGTPNTVAPLYAYQWSGGSSAVTEDINALLFGSYTLIVTDANLCTDTTNFNVAATDTVIANAGPDATFCIGEDQLLDGSASTVDNGTITFEWQSVPTTGILGTDDSLTVTPVGGNNIYQLIVTNSLGCADSDTVVLAANPMPLANAGNDQDMFYGQTVVIGGSPTGPAGTTLVWTPITGLDVDTISNPTSSALTTTTYYVTVTDTATGCSSMDSMIVTVLPTIIIPNGISPNGDGKNDVWIIDAIYKFPNSEVEVYNRWGELLYSKTGYDNTWGGTYNGKLLPIGTYYYVVKLNDPLYPDIYTGPITIFK